MADPYTYVVPVRWPAEPTPTAMGDYASRAGAEPAIQPLVLTVDQAASALNIGTTLMWELVRSGKVESITIGRLRRVPADALEKFVSHLRGVA